jgi:hypothetical protein
LVLCKKQYIVQRVCMKKIIVGLLLFNLTAYAASKIDTKSSHAASIENEEQPGLSITQQRWHIRLGYGEAPSILLIDFDHRPTVKELTDRCKLFAMSLVNKELDFHPLESIYQYKKGPLENSRASGKKIYTANITLTDQNIPDFNTLPVDVMILTPTEQKEYTVIKGAWEKNYAQDITLMKSFIARPKLALAAPSSSSSSSSSPAAAAASAAAHAPK